VTGSIIKIEQLLPRVHSDAATSQPM